MTTNLDAFWMPFTNQKYFKQKNPKLFTQANGMYFTTTDNQKILDASSGLWCVNAGHGRTEITEAVTKQLTTMDYAPCFQTGHPLAFQLAERLSYMAPGDINKVFFTNSGSEAVDSALKIALAYHRANGESQRTMFIGRERAYHGVGLGGISVGGIGPNRHSFTNRLGQVDHLRHTHGIKENLFSKGLPETGAYLADDLNRLIALHGAENIAAVIVEPVPGSTGWLPSTSWVSRKKLEKHVLSTIFYLFLMKLLQALVDWGTNFAANYFDIIPDMITSAKGLTNAAVPMGAVLCQDKLYDTILHNNQDMIELFHWLYVFRSSGCGSSSNGNIGYLRKRRFVSARYRYRILLGRGSAEPPGT